MDEHREKNGRDFIWVQDLRYDDFFRLQDYEHLIVSKIFEIKEGSPISYWEAAIYEDDTCQMLVGREIFNTQQEAKEFLENYVLISLKNREKS
ncbi:MAG: hypothetical protein L0207_02580 [Chlamydiae bacterium]|nr:hypothetical protein [Chlamydiota bacterium]